MKDELSEAGLEAAYAASKPHDAIGERVIRDAIKAYLPFHNLNGPVMPNIDRSEVEAKLDRVGITDAMRGSPAPHTDKPHKPDSNRFESEWLEPIPIFYNLNNRLEPLSSFLGLTAQQLADINLNGNDFIFLQNKINEIIIRINALTTGDMK